MNPNYRATSSREALEYQPDNMGEAPGASTMSWEAAAPAQAVAMLNGRIYQHSPAPQQSTRAPDSASQQAFMGPFDYQHLGLPTRNIWQHERNQHQTPTGNSHIFGNQTVKNEADDWLKDNLDRTWNTAIQAQDQYTPTQSENRYTAANQPQDQYAAIQTQEHPSTTQTDQHNFNVAQHSFGPSSGQIMNPFTQEIHPHISDLRAQSNPMVQPVPKTLSPIGWEVKQRAQRVSTPTQQENRRVQGSDIGGWAPRFPMTYNSQAAEQYPPAPAAQEGTMTFSHPDMNTNTDLDLLEGYTNHPTQTLARREPSFFHGAQNGTPIPTGPRLATPQPPIGPLAAPQIQSPRRPPAYPANYHVMTMAINGQGGHRSTAQEVALRQATGMSPNYRGDPGNARNHDQFWVPEHHNCSFWLENLRPDVDVTMLLASIRDIGRVFATHINKEECRPGGKHQFAAAKLTFFTVEEATKFHQFARVERRLIVGGLPARVRRHRTRVGPQVGLDAKCSRVLLITGPRDIVNEEFLNGYWSKFFVYQTDLVVNHGTDALTGNLEWRFSSFRAQAQQALKLMKSQPEFRNVQVEYGMDPCAYPDGACINGLGGMQLAALPDNTDFPQVGGRE